MAATFQIALTAEQFNALVAKYNGGVQSGNALKQVGLQFLQSGTLPETSGVVLSYSVNRASDVSVIVTFTIQKKPFFATAGMIESRVRTMIGV